MKIFELIGAPGTTLSRVGNSGMAPRQDSNMSWDAQFSHVMSSRATRGCNELIRMFADARAKALGLAFVPVTVDLPIYKQVSVPSSPHERSP